MRQTQKNMKIQTN